jgi:two-component sensor histidine kinase
MGAPLSIAWLRMRAAAGALPAQKSLLLTLAFPELATNAAKYGALSNAAGRVRVTWDVIDQRGRRGLDLS